MIGSLALVLSAGLGIMNSFQTESSQLKSFELGLEATKPMYSARFAMGRWYDDSHFPGARDSDYISYRWGVGPRFETYNLTFYLGPAFITAPDTILGSNLQFNPGFEWMLKDKRNIRLGLYLDHFSNAGFVRPNVGRNFFGVRLKV